MTDRTILPVSRQLFLWQRGSVGEKVPCADGAVDPRVFLIHDPAGAEIQVTDLGIAHLLGRESDGGLRGPDQGMGISCPKGIQIRGFSAGNSVIFGFFAVTPSIEDHQR